MKSKEVRELTNEEFDTMILPYFEGELSEENQAAFEAHMHSSPISQDMITVMQEWDEILKKLGKEWRENNLVELTETDLSSSPEEYRQKALEIARRTS